MQVLKGLATGIGSLPHKDAEAALGLIFKYAPNIPFWPQLPKRDIREGMVVQFTENIPCLRISREGLFFESENKEQELEIFYERMIANDTDYFKISQDYAQGLYAFKQKLEKSNLKDIKSIKCQITGPFTFAVSIKDEKGIALLHDPVFMQVIIKGLTLKALWQIKFFEKFGKKIIMFIDEPYLGCFGSAYTPINREDVVKGLTELAEGIKSESLLLRQGFGRTLSAEAERESCSAKADVLVGVHCCGNTDWSIFTDISSIDIISFDSFSFLDKFILYGDNLKGFLDRGGIICWGIVPTQEFLGKETPDLLVERLTDGINALAKKGVERNLLLNNLLVSPSCGLGTLDTVKSEKIFRLLSQTSSLARNK